MATSTLLLISILPLIRSSQPLCTNVDDATGTCYIERNTKWQSTELTQTQTLWIVQFPKCPTNMFQIQCKHHVRSPVSQLCRHLYRRPIFLWIRRYRRWPLPSMSILKRPLVLHQLWFKWRVPRFEDRFRRLRGCTSQHCRCRSEWDGNHESVWWRCIEHRVNIGRQLLHQQRHLLLALHLVHYFALRIRPRLWRECDFRTRRDLTFGLFVLHRLRSHFDILSRGSRVCSGM